MSDNLFNVSYYNNQQDYFQKPYSDITAKQIDEEVKQIIAEQYARAKAILTEHADGHAKVAQLLIDREVIFAEDVEEIFGKRQWTSRSDEIIAENERIARERKAKEQSEIDKKEQEQKAEIDRLIPEANRQEETPQGNEDRSKDEEE
ncbi:MAG: cell division protein FtsH, partial [Prevotellaceae bacterium]|nr:cell division protein FtsH [Prevotellaceae bacterium]